MLGLVLILVGLGGGLALLFFNRHLYVDEQQRRRTQLRSEERPAE